MEAAGLCHLRLYIKKTTAGAVPHKCWQTGAAAGLGGEKKLQRKGGLQPVVMERSNEWNSTEFSVTGPMSSNRVREMRCVKAKAFRRFT